MAKERRPATPEKIQVSSGSIRVPEGKTVDISQIVTTDPESGTTGLVARLMVFRDANGKAKKSIID